MADHGLPTLTSTYTNFLTQMSTRVDDAMKSGRSDTVTLTNPPIGTIRWNVASSIWEHNTGTVAVPVWSALTATYGINVTSATRWTTGRTIAVTGDITGTSAAFDGQAALSFATTLATVNSNVGTFGSASAIPVVTVNAKGLITAVTTAALGTVATQAANNVSITGGSVSGTNLTLVQSTTAAPTAEGRVEWDTDDNTLKIGDGVGTKTFADIASTATRTNGTYGSGNTWNGNVISVAYGGTGVATLTGIAKGNGTGAFTAAVAGDFPTLNQNTTGNAATVTTNANLTGEVTSVGNAATVTNGAVIGKVLTGYVSGDGTVAATDTILQAINKLNGNDLLKQVILVSGTNIKTINNVSLLGSGNIKVTSSGSDIFLANNFGGF